MSIIYLIGFMGSGKSTIGKQLSKKINYSFVDLDRLIEKDNGMSISEIFETKGEAEFRKLEHNALKKVSQLQHTIIACGGGTPCFYDNMTLMKESGLTIYIKLSPKMLADRLSQSKTPRPLLKNKSREELLSYVKDLLEKREDHYHQAGYTVLGKNLDIDGLAGFLKDKI